MISTSLRSPWLALAIAMMLQPRWVRAQPAPPPPPPGYPPSQSYPPSQGYPPPPPTYAPPTYAPPTYGPPGYAPPPYSTPSYAPEEITDFDDSAPTPPGYTRVERTRKGLIIGGAVTLGATFAVTAFAAAIAADVNQVDGSNTDVSSMLIPVVGPFLQIQHTDSSVGRFWLTALGAGQAAGAIMLVYGLTSPKIVLVRNDQLSLGPMIDRGGRGVSGLTLTGSF
ncbi:MAG TPA: hypothetical protein VIX73_37925 [Kofleriaceae bacterium]